MRLEQILDETLELLIANDEDPKFKSFGDLQKSKYQNSITEEERFLKSDMYKGQIGNKEAAKKGHKTRKQNKNYKKDIEKAAKNRSEWYKNPENMKKFKERLKSRKK